MHRSQHLLSIEAAFTSVKNVAAVPVVIGPQQNPVMLPEIPGGAKAIANTSISPYGFGWVSAYWVVVDNGDDVPVITNSHIQSKPVKFTELLWMDSPLEMWGCTLRVGQPYKGITASAISIWSLRCVSAFQT